MRKYHTGFNDTNLMTGDERYGKIGNELDDAVVTGIIKKFRSLKLYWSCLEKAVITAETIKPMFKFVQVVIGGLDVMSNNSYHPEDSLLRHTKTAYGYDFNPPFEFHAWVVANRDLKSIDDMITIDLALPGVIEYGSILEDEHGKFIVGRSPDILISKDIPSWLKYQAYITYPFEDAT